MGLGRSQGGQEKGCVWPHHACTAQVTQAQAQLWVRSSLAKPSPLAPAAFEQRFDSLPFLPSHPGTMHSAKNILEDISNMFDDLADQLDAMLD